jgi:predicted flap endonuclease-1-like 5' DNA nuclease
MAKLTQIEGIGETYSAKLEEAGIATQEKLLEAGGTPKGRKELAEKTGISPKLILGWINRADLARVKGIGEEYADLLELAGVDTVPELAQRNAANLHTKMAEVAEARGNVVRRIPSEKDVEKWIAQAKELPRAINY